MRAKSSLVALRCVSCRRTVDFHAPVNTCPSCGSVLSAAYDHEALRETFTPGSLAGRVKSLWRYSDVLPVQDEANTVTLGEGLTPIVRLSGGVLMKDDGVIPTGTFKARGMTVAVSRAKELSLERLAVPTAGNSGAALACYAARAGLRARVYMPRETPTSMIRECAAFGAEVVQVDGNISDAGARMKAEAAGYFDMSTLKEPYRLEGKKTMGYEIAEQLDFELPDVVVYPTGGGTGLIGMWKAFDEMESLGWIGSKRPRMFSVQSDACAPVADAFAAGSEAPDPEYPDGKTVASGLRVPKPFGGRQILKVLKESHGGAVKVPEKDVVPAMRALAKEGVFACPEGAAAFAGLEALFDDGTARRDETSLVYNTGTGLKYLDLFV